MTISDFLLATKGKLAVSRSEFCRLFGVSDTLFDREFREGRLRAVRRGRRILVGADVAIDWLAPEQDTAHKDLAEPGDQTNRESQEAAA
jgi:hypothetical protein